MSGLRDRDAIRADAAVIGPRAHEYLANSGSALSRLAADVAPLLDRVAELEAQDREMRKVAPRLRAEARVAELEAEVERLTGINRSGDMPRYLQARERMIVAESERDAAVAAEAALREQMEAFTAECEKAYLAWSVPKDLRAILAAVPSSTALTSGAAS